MLLWDFARITTFLGFSGGPKVHQKVTEYKIFWRAVSTFIGFGHASMIGSYVNLPKDHHDGDIICPLNLIILFKSKQANLSTLGILLYGAKHVISLLYSCGFGFQPSLKSETFFSTKDIYLPSLKVRKLVVACQCLIVFSGES